LHQFELTLQLSYRLVVIDWSVCMRSAQGLCEPHQPTESAGPGSPALHACLMELTLCCCACSEGGQQPAVYRAHADSHLKHTQQCMDHHCCESGYALAVLLVPKLTTPSTLLLRSLLCVTMSDS
jgi:hypothetical protein